jgi:hypothetical protein
VITCPSGLDRWGENDLTSDNPIDDLSSLATSGVKEIGVVNLPDDVTIEPIKLEDIDEITFEGVDKNNKRVVVKIKMRGRAVQWMKIAGFIFVAFTVGSLFLLVIGVFPVVSKTIFFNVWIAFCAAASFSFIGGEAAAEGKVPIPNVLGGSPVAFSLAGGISVFVIVLLLMVTLNS